MPMRDERSDERNLEAWSISGQLQASHCNVYMATENGWGREVERQEADWAALHMGWPLHNQQTAKRASGFGE